VMLEDVKPLFMTPAEAAKALSVSRSKLYVMLRAGEIPYRKIGAAIRIPVMYLEQMAATACAIAEKNGPG
jgi:excisionase family DNA binding protein